MPFFSFATADNKLSSIFLYKFWYAFSFFLLVHIYLWKWEEKKNAVWWVPVWWNRWWRDQSDIGSCWVFRHAFVLPKDSLLSIYRTDWKLSFMEGRMTVFWNGFIMFFSVCIWDPSFVWGIEVQFWPGPKIAVGNILNKVTKTKVMVNGVQYKVRILSSNLEERCFWEQGGSDKLGL